MVIKRILLLILLIGVPFVLFLVTFGILDGSSNKCREIVFLLTCFPIAIFVSFLGFLIMLAAYVLKGFKKSRFLQKKSTLSYLLLALILLVGFVFISFFFEFILSFLL